MTTKNIFACFILLFASLAGLNCKSTGTSTPQKEMYSIYIDQFKLTYFRQTLLKGYNNSEAIQEIINSDHSGFTEPVLTNDDYKLIDSLTIGENEKMKMDSIEGDQRAEGAQGKRPLQFVLDRFNSKWLDSLANKRYRNSGIDKTYNE